jgi:methyl-accepting chemotaxis protein
MTHDDNATPADGWSDESRSGLGTAVEALESDIAVALGAVDDIRRELDVSIGEHVELAGHIKAEGVSLAQAVGTVQSRSEDLIRRLKDLGDARDVIRAESGALSRTVEVVGTTAADVRTQLDELSSAIRDIAGVVDVIERVASDTRLLALNATIEAQRFGVQGRAFGVIAGEVRALADDTSAATSDISSRIGRLNRTAAACRTTIERMDTLTGDLSPSFQAVSDALSRQEEVIAVVHDSATELKQANTLATASADGLLEFTGVAVTEAERIKTSSNRLADFMREFSQRLSSSIRHTAAAGRRREERTPLGIGAVIEANGRQFSCTTADISPGGALVWPDQGLSLDPGTTITFGIREVGEVPARVAQVSSRGIHIAFDNDQRWRELIAGIISAASQIDAPKVTVVQEAAARATAVLSAALVSGAISRADLFPKKYDLVPFSNPRQFTCAALPIYERLLQPLVIEYSGHALKPVYATFDDRNGYVPVHHPDLSQPPRKNDPEFNDRFCRNRRLKLDAETLSIVRNRKPHFITRYRREIAGDVQIYKDISAPIVIDGELWGAFRAGWPI